MAATHYLYRFQPSRVGLRPEDAAPEKQAAAEAHVAYLDDLARQGILVMLGRTLNTDPSAFGVILFKADSIQAARRIMEADPAVMQGLVQVELYPFLIEIGG